MRKWINLVETATAHWPETIDGWDLAQRVAELHHSPEDFDEGDIEQNISAFGTYHLQQVPLSELKRGLFTIYDDLVTTYAGQTTAAPPVIVDLEHRLVIDGNHRVEAAMKRGEETISAYVGDPSTYEAPDDDDDDEWHPDLNEGEDATSFSINVPVSEQRRFLRGGCFVFAITLMRALKRNGFKPKLMGLFADDRCHHAFVVMDGHAYDCRGKLELTSAAIGAGSLLGEDGTIKPLSIAEIKQHHDLDFTNIKREMPRYLRFYFG
jgi:hypothetical protein